MISRAAFSLCALLSASVLSWAYYTGGNSIAAIGFLCLGLLLLIAGWLDSRPVISLAAFLMIGGAAVGIAIDLPAWSMFLSVILVLSAWDLSVFIQQMKLASKEDNLPALERSHLAWLSGVAAAGFILAILSGVVPIRLSFGWMVLLVLASTYALIHLVSQVLRRSSKPGGPTVDH